MKQATITLKLSKEHDVIKHHVTPLEALLLTAEHHRNFGGCPVEVHKDTITDVTVDVKDKDGKVTGKKVVERTFDEELDRLRGKYAVNKVNAVSAVLKEMPATFEAALERGVKIVLPTNPLSQTKLV